MGLLDSFRNYRQNRMNKRLDKAARLVKNPKAIREDRWAALEFLASVDEREQAIPALLERFDYSLEHGINDTREKELAMKGVVRFGKEALPFVREKIRTTTRIAWPIKILKEVGETDQVVAILKSILNYSDVSFDQSAVDKNYDILCYLRDYQLGEDYKKLAHFLNDPDERVRFACVETLIEQNAPDLDRMLERFLFDNSSENRRIRQAVIVAFLKNKWKVQDTEAVAENPEIEPGVVINPQGYIEVRAH